MTKIELADVLIGLVEKWKAAILLKRSVAEKNAILYVLAQGDPAKEGDALHKLLVSKTEFYSASEIEFIIHTIENTILLQDDELHKMYSEKSKNQPTIENK